METYTELTLKVKYHDGKEYMYIVKNDQWDNNVEKIVEMCMSLLLSAGFRQEDINSEFGSYGG